MTRSRGDYKGQIHFAELRDNSRNKRGDAAWNWINTYFNELADICPYKCIIADRTSTRPSITRYRKPSQLYNYAAKLAVRGGIAWSFKNFDALVLTIYSERRTLAADDNFASYLPREIGGKPNSPSSTKRGAPEVALASQEVQMIDGDPGRVAPENKGHCEFIQLTDLLTSAIHQAINASAQQVIKIDVGKFVAQWIDDTRRPTWTQSLGLHRHFSVSCFPGPDGGFYDVPLGIENRNQMKLLD